MSDYSMADLANLMGVSNVPVAKNSNSRTGNTELNMEDFLQLMIVQLQNQTIDDTMDTSEMMNQMVQMQMISAITNMTETSIMSYASSLVGKVVTIGIVNGNTLEEREIQVIGTGVSNGQQVIFGSDGETYALSQIMAVGKLPDIKKPEESGEGEDGEGTEGVDQTGTGAGTTETPKDPGDTSELPDDRPVDGTDETGGTDNTGDGTDGTVDPVTETQGEV